jgi:hypothetical protein
VLRWGRLGFALAALADGARNCARRLRGPAAAVELIGGVEFRSPALRLAETSSYYRARVLRKRYRSPEVAWPFPRVAGGPEPLTLRAPLILATFHLGPLPALGALVQRLPAPTAILMNATGVPQRRAELLGTEGSEAQRVAAFTEAARILRGGGFVLVVVDGFGSARLPVTLFDREASISAGAFRLARLGGAAMLPIAVRWQGSGVRFDAGAPIAPGDPGAMAAALAAWLEGYLRRHPEELTFPVARLLGSAPAA